MLAELLTTRDFYVNAKYGIEGERGQARATGRTSAGNTTPPSISRPTGAGRRPPADLFSKGRARRVLTHPAWLAAWSGNFDNHPVQRGKWIRTHLLGGSVPDVPIGVDARVPEMEHTVVPRPPRDGDPGRGVLALPQKDGLRSESPLNGTTTTAAYQRLDAGQPVDASGRSLTHHVSRTPPPLRRPTEMMDFLAKSERVEQVFVRHAFRFFMGSNETLGDANTLQDAHKAYRDSDGSFNELVTSLLTSDSFLLRSTAGS